MKFLKYISSKQTDKETSRAIEKEKEKKPWQRRPVWLWASIYPQVEGRKAQRENESAEDLHHSSKEEEEGAKFFRKL